MPHGRLMGAAALERAIQALSAHLRFSQFRIPWYPDAGITGHEIGEEPPSRMNNVLRNYI